MTQEQFEAACAAAIKEFHDPVFDGPLLTSIRMQSQPQAVQGDWLVYPEYAAVIGHWPTQVPFGDYGQFMVEPNDCIIDLITQARKLALARQAEAVEDEPIDPEKAKYDKLLD